MRSHPPNPFAELGGGVGVSSEVGVFTELNTRRLGPVRRYFLRHPVAMDLVVAAVFGVAVILGAFVKAGPPDRCPPGSRRSAPSS